MRFGAFWAILNFGPPPPSPSQMRKLGSECILWASVCVWVSSLSFAHRTLCGTKFTVSHAKFTVSYHSQCSHLCFSNMAPDLLSICLADCLNGFSNGTSRTLWIYHCTVSWNRDTVNLPPHSVLKLKQSKEAQTQTEADLTHGSESFTRWLTPPRILLHTSHPVQGLTPHTPGERPNTHQPSVRPCILAPSVSLLAHWREYRCKGRCERWCEAVWGSANWWKGV